MSESNKSRHDHLLGNMFVHGARLGCSWWDHLLLSRDSPREADRDYPQFRKHDFSYDLTSVRCEKRQLVM